MRNLIIVSLLVIISGFYINDAFADTQNLSGSSHGNEISLVFSDGNVSGTITLEDHTINLSDVKVIERNDRLLIVDKQNDLKILSKQLSSNKYIILVKINSEDLQTKLRFITNSDSVNKNSSQRNLFDAMEEKRLENQRKELNTMTPGDSQLLEKQKALDAAFKVRDERLARLAEKASKVSGEVIDPKTILEEYRKLKESQGTGPGLLLKEEIKGIKKVNVVEAPHVETKVFLSIPHHQEWKKVLRYTALVTDDSGHRYDPLYKEYVGNVLQDVKISGTVKDPSNNILQTFIGTTDHSGGYLGTFLIPDQSTTRGEYVISIYAEKTFKDNSISTSSNDGIFYVFPRSGGGTNYLPPIANAGVDQSEDDVINNPPNILNPNITLDGTGSSDPLGFSITYLWTIIDDKGTGITLDDVTSSTPSLVLVPASDVAVDTDVIFGLVVRNGVLDSPQDTVTVTIVDSGLVP